jgi:hypothetical protein
MPASAMNRLFVNAAIAALIGAVAGAAALVVAFRIHPALAFEMDRDLPGRTSSGLYPVEVSTTESFAWTSDRAQFTVPGMDRRAEWTCVARVRGSRPPGMPQPIVSLTIDGQPAGPGVRATDEYQDIRATVTVRSTSGIRLAILSSETFRPPTDPRPLGVQLDRLSCTPGGTVWPPMDTLKIAALASAILGAAFALIGMTVMTHRLATLLVAVGLAVPLSSGLGPYYAAYADRVMWLAVWIALVSAGGVGLMQVVSRRTMRVAASFAIGFSAGVLFLKLAALLHPSKAVIDALFHAHRLGDVLAGKYFFTQVMPGNVQFPYAIALYVFASPWASLTRDHVALLRIVVSASEAAAGLLLYWAVARTWRDVAVAAAVVVLYHLVPVSYWVVQNANLTNAFGQSAAVAAMALLTASTLTPRHILQVFSLAMCAALAFLSHVSSAMLLGATMLSAVAVSCWRGGRALWPTGLTIVAALVMAAALSVALYYGRAEFYDAYRSIRSTQAEQPVAVPDVSGSDTGGARLAEGALPTMTLTARIGNAAGLVGDALGWPILALALLGLWRVIADREGDRLVWAVAAWALAGSVFVVAGIVLPGGVGHQRQAIEFIARAAYAASPGVLVLAGRGAIWSWQAGLPLRGAVVILGGLALLPAVRTWISWTR